MNVAATLSFVLQTCVSLVKRYLLFLCNCTNVLEAKYFIIKFVCFNFMMWESAIRTTNVVTE